MEYNQCETCGANGGRAGLLIRLAAPGSPAECANCHETRKTGTAVVHSNLSRTPAEMELTFGILSETAPVAANV